MVSDRYFLLVNCGVILCNENRLKLTGSIAFLYLFGLNCDFEFSLKYRQIEDYFDQARVTFERPPQVNIPFSDPIRSSKITHEVFRVLYHDMIRHYIGEDLAKISKQKLRPTFSECEFLKIVVRFSLRVNFLGL